MTQQTVSEMVTPNGSIRITPQGIVLQSGEQIVEIGPHGIRILSTAPLEISCDSDIEFKAQSVTVNGEVVQVGAE